MEGTDGTDGLACRGAQFRVGNPASVPGEAKWRVTIGDEATDGTDGLACRGAQFRVGNPASVPGEAKWRVTIGDEAWFSSTDC